MSDTQTITEAKGTTSRLDVIRKLLAKAEAAATEQERDAYTEKAAELIAKYGVSTAMLADAGKTSDPIVDTVVWVTRPFGKLMMDLLWYIASPMGAEARTVKEHTGSEQVGQLKWRHGLRLFVHQSDLQRIEMLYTSVRNQALAGASRIKGEDKFGQDQKAHRESYIEGFSHAVAHRIRRAEEEAKLAAEAEREALYEQALLAGEITASRSVELVLLDRKSAVTNAMHLALYGKTTAEIEAAKIANRERWAEMDRRAYERHQAHVAEHEACERCKKAKSGYCNDHRDLRPSQARPRYHERVGDYYSDGYAAGQRADLGPSRTQVGEDSRKALG